MQQFTDPNHGILHSVVYLQVSTISQGLIFITRSQGWFFTERPSLLLMSAFVVAQLVATFIAVYADWGFTSIYGCGWSWAGIAWIWNFVWFTPLDLIKFGLQRVFHPKSGAEAVAADKLSRRASRRSSAASATASARYYSTRTHSISMLDRPKRRSIVSPMSSQ